MTQFPNGQSRWRVSKNGGTFPTWRGDSKEIWYFGWDSTLHTTAVSAKSNEIELAPVQTMFAMSYVTAVGNAYDVSPDGKRVIVSTFPENVSTPMVLVTNWPGELKK